MRYAVIKLSYDCDPVETEYKFNVRTEVLRISFTLDGAYEFVGKWLYKTVKVMKMDCGEVKSQLETNEYIHEKFDKNKNRNNVRTALVERIWDMDYVTEIYIQAIDEVTQM